MKNKHTCVRIYNRNESNHLYEAVQRRALIRPSDTFEWLQREAYAQVSANILTAGAKFMTLESSAVSVLPARRERTDTSFCALHLNAPRPRTPPGRPDPGPGVPAQAPRYLFVLVFFAVFLLRGLLGPVRADTSVSISGNFCRFLFVALGREVRPRRRRRPAEAPRTRPERLHPVR